MKMNLLVNGCLVVLIGLVELTAGEVVLAAGAVVSASGHSTLPPGQAARRSGYALLVGCTRYDNRPRLRPLVGPANDVELMRHVLEDSYGFDPSHIVVLSEASRGEEGTRVPPRPQSNRAGIQRTDPESEAERRDRDLAFGTWKPAARRPGSAKGRRA